MPSQTILVKLLPHEITARPVPLEQSVETLLSSCSKALETPISVWSTAQNLFPLYQPLVNGIWKFGSPLRFFDSHPATLHTLADAHVISVLRLWFLPFFLSIVDYGMYHAGEDDKACLLDDITFSDCHYLTLAMFDLNDQFRESIRDRLGGMCRRKENRRALESSGWEDALELQLTYVPVAYTTGLPMERRSFYLVILSLGGNMYVVERH
ncbi:hypothetical protein BLNAU_2281 [Blattamonas nauphoetae]|uniref:Uncharacterized protein n=1 Tax=Blattamonas nauphoetae TaxID=2049346 RepID=A0ABQ9YGH0_9EUKA|nr:hypothetical protein BLNAU_2281 [Blattamonas nauphoetae]